MAVVTRLIPDETTLGQVDATFKTRFYPTATESTHGPYTLGNPTSVRFQGKQVRMKVASTVGADWRVGKFRFDVTQGARR